MSRDNVIKHLEMLQGIINRMASNSFLIKGWTVVLTGASFWLLARSGANCSGKYGIMAVVAVFWGLDGYYLRQERLFRKLYNNVTLRSDTDFLMDTSPFEREVASWIETCFRGSKGNSAPTILVFYGIVEAAILVIL